MDLLTNSEFLEFMESFKERYYLSVSEISRSHSKDFDSLVNSSFKMFSLDDICKDSKILKENLPKTIDGLFYKISPDGRLSIYLVEFKFFNMDGVYSNYSILNRLEYKLKKKNKQTLDYYSDKKFISDSLLGNFMKIKESFMDDVEFSLWLKPFETIFVALPILYEEYCLNNPEIDKKDFKHFLANVDINLSVVNRISYEKNVTEEKTYYHSILNALEYQYGRLVLANVINSYKIDVAKNFKTYIQNEGLS